MAINISSDLGTSKRPWKALTLKRDHWKSITLESFPTANQQVSESAS